MYTDEELLDGIRSLADEIGRTPTVREMKDQGDYSASVYTNRFGSWNSALEAAGYEPNRNTGLSKDDLIEELTRLGDELGHPPRLKDLKENSRYSRQVYVNEFGSWNNALESAGFSPRPSTVEIPIADLIEDVQRMADKLGRSPRQADVIKHGQYSTQAYYTKFDSWVGVLQAADLPEPEPHQKIPTEDLLNDLRRVSDEVGRPPTQQDIRDHGEYSASTIFNRFGSLQAARKAAGLPPRKYQRSTSSKRFSDEELIKDLHELAEELGHPPTLQELRDHSSHSATTYIERFGSWQEALEAAGYPSRDPETEIPEETLIEDLQRVAEEVGNPPSVSQMNEHGNHWASTYRRHFGSWSNALKEAGFEDVSNPGPIPENELIDELRRLENELGDVPTMSKMDEDGEFAASTYVRRFGSWSAALEASGFDPNPAPSKVSDEALKDELRRLAEELGKSPSSTEMDEHGEYASSTYQRHFGSWSSAVESVLNENKSK